jgi:CheY-like chemotaxis protein
MGQSGEKFIALYIDGSYQSRLLIPRLLQSFGFETILADYAENIFEQVDRLPRLDIIVLDDVYDVKCLEYCVQLKASERTKNIPLIVIVVNDKVTQEKVMEAGADKYLRVPIAIEEFQDIINSYLP